MFHLYKSCFHDVKTRQFKYKQEHYPSGKKRLLSRARKKEIRVAVPVSSTCHPSVRERMLHPPEKYIVARGIFYSSQHQRGKKAAGVSPPLAGWVRQSLNKLCSFSAEIRVSMKSSRLLLRLAFALGALGLSGGCVFQTVDFSSLSLSAC
jgi:hypothetical protein